MTEAVMQSEFALRPGSGWAFPRGAIGPDNDQQIIVSGTVSISKDRNLFLDMRVPKSGGTLIVKIKDPVDWTLIAQLELPKPRYERQARRGTFKLGGRNFTLQITNGMTKAAPGEIGRPCYRIRIPEIMSLPLL